MKSPFKFPDSYTREDRGIFFGRDHEISELYRRVFQSKILLVYGVSGTGKSSLINCGLASRFDDSDWLPVNVRRGSNIINSLNEAFKKQALSPLKKYISVSEKLQSIYLDHFKPIYLIFDQFEELFIFGSTEEKICFIKLIKEVVESETQVRVIISIREEFLAGITEFENDLPDIFSNRFRVEKMKRANAIRAIEKDIIEVRQFIENAFSVYEKRGKLLAEDDLKYIAPYEDKLFLNKSIEAFIYKSRNEIQRSGRRRRNISIAASVTLFVVLFGFTLWAFKEKQKSTQNYLKAKANNFNYLSKETIETDPTIALRLAEYSASIDSGNKDIIKNLNRIYSDNNFYRVVSEHEAEISSLAFSPDGKSILTGSYDKTARLWNLNGNLLQIFNGHQDAINAVAFSPDGKSILTGSMDNTAMLSEIREPLKDFQKKNIYQELSVKQKFGC